MANYWMYLNSSDNLQHLSIADNHYVSDEDLHVLCELDKMLSLNFSGCTQIEDEGLAVCCLTSLVPLDSYFTAHHVCWCVWGWVGVCTWLLEKTPLRVL